MFLLDLLWSGRKCNGIKYWKATFYCSLILTHFHKKKSTYDLYIACNIKIKYAYIL